MSRKHKPDGLESKVYPLENKIYYDKNNDPYLPYCSFKHHRGIVLRENVCLTRECRHYHRLYVQNGMDSEEVNKLNSKQRYRNGQSR